jgi:hypothetical protein
MKTFVDFVNEAKVDEMALADINVKAILKDWNSSDKKRRDEIAEEISGEPHQDRKRILNDLLEIGYDDIQDSMKKLGIVS